MFIHIFLPSSILIYIYTHICKYLCLKKKGENQGKTQRIVIWRLKGRWLLLSNGHSSLEDWSFLRLLKWLKISVADLTISLGFSQTSWYNLALPVQELPYKYPLFGTWLFPCCSAPIKFSVPVPGGKCSSSISKCWGKQEISFYCPIQRQRALPQVESTFLDHFSLSLWFHQKSHP